MKTSLSRFMFLSLATFLFAGCMVVPQTYTPRKLHPTPRINAFLPDNYEDDLGKDDNPPAISVVVDGNDGGLDVDVCSRGWDWRRIKVLADQCSLTDDHGLRYRLGTFESIDFANKEIGASRWIQYTTYAYGPLPSARRHAFYGNPHTLRVVYTEDGRRYTAERQFAATYPLITPFQMLHFTN